MLVSFAVLVVCAAATVLAVRLLLIRGIVVLCHVLRLSAKTEGQIIGYATSVPELVVLVASALAGVFDAGFWNIASSNIINWVLFLSAVITFRQQRDLFARSFVDELAFGVLSVGVPLALYGARIAISPPLAFGLIGLFVFYKAMDHRVNERKARPNVHPRPVAHAGLGRAFMLMIAGTAIVVVAGRYLGSSAAALVERMGTPSWLVGWLLGGITSIPEMTSFFEIYRLQKSRKALHQLNDTQEALDALVASNMSNLGIILPLGALVYMLVR